MKSLLLIIIFALSACADMPQTRSILEDGRESVPPAHSIANVPWIEQTENHCGPASLAMVSEYEGVHVSLNGLTSMMFTPARKGSLQLDLIGTARRLGLVAVPTFSLRNILIEINADHPVIVLENLGSKRNPVWHYAVLVGYDLATKELRFHSGLNRDFILSMNQFERVWSRAGAWSLVVLKAGTLPATATLEDDLNAASALERTQKFEEAKTVYLSINEKWPESMGALFGLGNVYYALGDYRASVMIFEKASKLAPQSADVRNNLAEGYLKLRQHKVARH